MEDFDETVYFDRKNFYLNALRDMAAQVDRDSEEDKDAFYNAVEDFYNEEI